MTLGGDVLGRHDVAVPGDDDAARTGLEPGEGSRPRERVAVAEIRRRALLDEIPRKDDAGTLDGDEDVVVGVPETGVLHRDEPAADVDRGGVAEHSGRRRDPDLVDLVPLGLVEPRRCLRLRLRPEGEQPVTAPDVAVDLGGGEHTVAEGVVPVPVGVDHPAHRKARDGRKLAQHLPRLGVGRPRVDDEDTVATDDEPDVEVERPVAAAEHTIGELVPDAVHGRGAYGAAAGAATAPPAARLDHTAGRAWLPERPSSRPPSPAAWNSSKRSGASGRETRKPCIFEQPRSMRSCS